MAYDMSSILVNVPLKPSGEYIFYVERFVDITMNILMSKGVHYCTPNKSKCLLHHYINAFDLDKKESIDETVTTFFDCSVRYFTASDLEINSLGQVYYDFFIINYFYETFINTSYVIKF